MDQRSSCNVPLLLDAKVQISHLVYVHATLQCIRSHRLPLYDGTANMSAGSRLSNVISWNLLRTFPNPNTLVPRTSSQQGTWAVPCNTLYLVFVSFQCGYAFELTFNQISDYIIQSTPNSGWLNEHIPTSFVFPYRCSGIETGWS